MTRAGDRRVVVVTGGGGGIGAAIAEELGRRGDFVVTVDPLVSVDGVEQLPVPEETTAGRIVAAGGSARASSVSVTDGDGVRRLFDELIGEHGRLDAVVNVAGITRPTGFTSGSDEDWRSVLEVHLRGYLNILEAALPIMAAAGRGRILGVTSGSGWRAADTGAYGCAKRAVASLTWQLGAQPPTGVSVNAVSPIAATRMVTAALERAAAGRRGSGSAATGGLSLGSMPEADDLGPFGAHLASEDLAWCSGEIFFAGGAEVAVVEGPRLLEVVRTAGVTSLAHVLEAATTGALVPAEASQASSGGTNPRFGAAFDSADGDISSAGVASCAVVSDRPDLASAVANALEARGITCTTVPAGDGAGFSDTASALSAAVEGAGSLDAVVVALSGGPASSASTAWERTLAEHSGLVDQLHTDAGWARAVADHATQGDRAIRLVTLTDAATAGGRSRAQAAAQHARSARRATGDRVSACAVSIEGGEERTVAELTAHLVCSPETPALSGAELVAGPGWVGLRSHPRPRGSVSFGGPAVPDWLDATLRGIVGHTSGSEVTR